jgi:uncharacterized membrane protein
VATITAFKFDAADGARKALDSLILLQAQRPMAVIDAAAVCWPKGKSRPSTQQATPPVGPITLDGVFWGMLFGSIFFEPVIGRTTRWRRSALASALTDIGVDDSFIYQIRSRVTEGTSALFILARNAVMDGIGEASTGAKPVLIATKVLRDQEAKLRYLFAIPGTPPNDTAL